MTKYKVFTPNKDGKLSFTKKELEDLLNEVYNEGYNDGKDSLWTVSYGSSPITSTPYYTTTTTATINSLDSDTHCKCHNDGNTTYQCGNNEVAKKLSTANLFDGDLS